MLLEGIDQNGYWLEYQIEDKNRNIIGSAQFREGYDEDDELCDGTIFHFEVDDHCRQLGVGSNLMTTMLEKLKESGHKEVRIIIGKEPSFKTVEKFLKKYGFKNIKKSEKYFAIEAIRSR